MMLGVYELTRGLRMPGPAIISCLRARVNGGKRIGLFRGGR